MRNFSVMKLRFIFHMVLWKPYTILFHKHLCLLFHLAFPLLILFKLYPVPSSLLLFNSPYFFLIFIIRFTGIFTVLYFNLPLFPIILLVIFCFFFSAHYTENDLLSAEHTGRNILYLTLFILSKNEV